MRDRFGDWNLYHKLVATLAASMVVGVIVRALLVIDTAFEISSSQVIAADAESIWRFVITDSLRDDWQGEMVDMVELTGPTDEVESTRLLFWKRDTKRWQSVERTRAIVPGRSISLYQESDRDKRWVAISITILGECETRLEITEIIEPQAYQDRFWFFGERELHEKRQAASFEAMKNWTENSNTHNSGPCRTKTD